MLWPSLNLILSLRALQSIDQGVFQAEISNMLLWKAFKFFQVLCLATLPTDMAAATASMSRTRGIPCLWYQLMGAVDVASFTQGENQQELSGILAHRNIESSPLLQKATIIFQQKLAESTALQEAALELLKNCKSAEGISAVSDSAESLKEAAKSKYAITAALLLLQSAGVRGPSKCTDIVYQPGTPKIFTLLKGRKAYRSLPSEKERSLCLNELFQTDNSWTSYTSSLQDANTLCQVPSLENAQRAILEMLSDFQTIIPAWAETFEETQRTHLEFLREQRTRAQELSQLHRQQRDEIVDTHNEAKSAMTSMMHANKQHIDRMATELTTNLGSAHRDVEQMRKVSVRRQQNCIG